VDKKKTSRSFSIGRLQEPAVRLDAR